MSQRCQKLSCADMTEALAFDYGCRVVTRTSVHQSRMLCRGVVEGKGQASDFFCRLRASDEELAVVVVSRMIALDYGRWPAQIGRGPHGRAFGLGTASAWRDRALEDVRHSPRHLRLQRRPSTHEGIGHHSVTLGRRLDYWAGDS